MRGQVSVKGQGLAPRKDFATHATLHPHVFPHPRPVHHNVQAVLDQAVEGFVTLSAVVCLLTSLQMQFAASSMRYCEQSNLDYYVT